jgi:hypothetical protein
VSKPDPPTPPNPIATAAAQTGTNVSTGVANAYLNNVNQVTPTGNLTYDTTGSHQWTDPSTGQTYTIPTFTATQTQSPTGQQLQSLNDQTKINLGQMGLQQSNSIKSLLGNPMNFSGAPQAGNAQGILGVPQAATSFDAGGPIQNSFGDAGNIAQSYGPTDNFSADRQRVEDSLMARINPQLNQQQDKLRQQLADQGIRYGSAAYNNAFTPYNQQANDARFAAIGQAGSEQQRMTQEAQAQAQFQNAAQQQNYEQLLGRSSFANAAQGQQFAQNSALATFNNAGLAQQLAQQQSGFNAQNAARNQYMQEQYAQRNQPINEITSLMSGSQVANPNFVNTPGSQIATTDFAGITNQNFQNQMGIYNAQNQNYQQLMGGLLGLGAGALKASDERIKENIVPMGKVLAMDPDHDETKSRMATIFADTDKDELPIYQYSYKGDPASTRHIGPMAQDVERIDPQAVKSIGGVKHIDTRRVMGSILRAA